MFTYLVQSRRFLNFLAALTVVVFLTSVASAQTFDRYKPRSLPNRSSDPKLPEPEGEVKGNPKVLVDELKALIFVDHKDKIADGKIEATGVQIRSDSGLDMLRTAEFNQIAQSYLGGPISILRLNQMIRDVILLYRRNDQPVVDLSVPDQDITDGVVQVVVTEGRIGEVRVEKARFFNPQVLANQTYINPGERIYESVLLEELKWLNRDPFRSVGLELTPGDDFGETDIVFNVDDQRPIRVYGGYEDSGNRQTGLERSIYGINWGNAFDRDHDFGYQYTASSDFTTLRAHSGVYSIPLYSRDTLMFFGSFAEIQTQAAGVFGLTGKSWQASTRYQRNLRDWGRWQRRLDMGFDFKQTNTNLEFGGANVFASSADVAQMVLGLHLTRPDAYGVTTLGADAFYSPSGFSPGNGDARFNTIRANADSEYFYSRMYLRREFELPRGMIFAAKVTGQLSEANLLPSEQLGFGGYDTIRGYDYRGVNGDSGYVVNLELKTQPMDILCRYEGKMQLLAFHDFGNAYNHTLVPGEDPSVDLSSVGAGLRLAFSQKFQLRADYGWQVSQIATVPNPRERWHIGAIISH